METFFELFIAYIEGHRDTLSHKLNASKYYYSYPSCYITHITPETILQIPQTDNS